MDEDERKRVFGMIADQIAAREREELGRRLAWYGRMREAEEQQQNWEAMRERWKDEADR